MVDMNGAVGMLGRLMQSRAFARGAIGVLAIGLVILVGLALWGNRMTANAVSRVQTAGERASTWDELADQVNIEQDLMHSYLTTENEVHLREFSDIIGNGERELAVLARLARDDAERLNTANADAAYRSYTTVLRKVVTAEMTNLQRAAAGYNSELAAAAVRQVISKSRASERVATEMYLQQVNLTSGQTKVAASVAFTVCLVLLGVCTSVLVGHQRRVEYEAQHDSLTGLANRALLAQRVNAAIRSAQRRQTKIGLLLIDLDRFKEVNDALGHQAGDVLLQHVARRLERIVRDEDMVARLGGDEFAVLLPRLRSVAEAMDVGTRLFRTLLKPIELDGREIEVGSSIGVAAYPVHCQDADHLMRYADVAMYTAKRKGLGVVEYDPSQYSYDPRQLTMSGELRHAIEADELAVHYQPQVDTTTRQWLGVEALVRWQHPVRGLLAPMEFIPLAEQSGLIEALTEWVLGEALDQVVRWRNAGIPVPVAVNISPQCLVGERDLAERVGLLLHDRAIPPGMLTLEITESALVTDSQGSIARLARIRDSGVRLSIDDFGTGYSSMAYLQEMPVDELKIDRCFVGKLRSDANGAGIVRAVLDLAHNLGLNAVAEGVEDEETLVALADLGCEACQGYYLSHPLPADPMTRWLLERATGTGTPATPALAAATASGQLITSPAG